MIGAIYISRKLIIGNRNATWPIGIAHYHYDKIIIPNLSGVVENRPEELN